jgi:2-polyprenyl-3-methyl-5-hydroxy-6-metoxy-1,4-benzoquinol methylase
MELRLLDYDCGPGRLALPLARLAGPQAGMLAKVSTKAHAVGLQNIHAPQASFGGRWSYTLHFRKH